MIGILLAFLGIQVSLFLNPDFCQVLKIHAIVEIVAFDLPFPAFSSRPVIPLIEISSTPSSRTLAIGAAVNLTCEAWPSDRDDAYDRRWTKYIQWYDAQDRPVGAKCLQSTPKVLKLRCTLMLKKLSLEQFGNYTCEAENGYVGYCRRKTVEISLQGK